MRRIPWILAVLAALRAGLAWADSQANLAEAARTLQAVSLSTDPEELSQAGSSGQHILQGGGGMEASGGSVVAPEQARWRTWAGSGGVGSQAPNRFAPVAALPEHPAAPASEEKPKERPPSRLRGMMGPSVFMLGLYGIGQGLLLGFGPWLGIAGIVVGLFVMKYLGPKGPRK